MCSVIHVLDASCVRQTFRYQQRSKLDHDMQTGRSFKPNLTYNLQVYIFNFVVCSLAFL
jgi:hypothetical protein